MKMRTAALKRSTSNDAVLALELHQVQRGEIAGGVVEEHVFGAGIGGVDRLGAFAGVPFLDGAVVLHAGIAADPGAFGDLVAAACAASFFSSGLPVVTERVHHSCAVQGGFHELVADADGEVFVLIHDAAVGIAVVGAIVALLDERPGLLLLFLLGVDELLDVPVPVAQACSSWPRGGSCRRTSPRWRPGRRPSGRRADRWGGRRR